MAWEHCAHGTLYTLTLASTDLASMCFQAFRSVALFTLLLPEAFSGFSLKDFAKKLACNLAESYDSRGPSVKAVLRCTSGHNEEDRDRIESNQPETETETPPPSIQT